MEVTANNKIFGTINIIIFLIVVSSLGFWSYAKLNPKTHFDDQGKDATTTPVFEYSFNVDGSLEESGSMETSASKYWWLDSGGVFSITEGMGSTIQGDLSEDSKWRVVYAGSNPVDTDQGLHPQNIFRLLTKNRWKNFRQEMYFRINADNVSDSPNRNGSNGILLLSRFTGTGDLYYAGIRVDGRAIIKKKKDGKYTTLVDELAFDGTYNRFTNVNLLPKNVWIGLRTEVMTYNPDHVKIRLYMDVGETGNWQLIADADDTTPEDGQVINERGHAGIRIDFMDVDFKRYRVEELQSF